MGVARGIGWALRETLLTLAAALGVVCVILVILAQFAHVSLIMFSTGSMSPTIPAGSVALVREVPAAELAVGDIVTIDRPGQLPVTHRVTELAPGPTADARTVTMRGDANENEDPAPYVVTQGRLVLGSVPGLARVIVWFGSPWVLGGITLAAALLVMWAFWPRSEASQRTQQDPRRGTARHAVVVLIGLGCAMALASSPAAARAAAPSMLTVTSNMPTGGQHAMAPGAQAQWFVTANASGAPTKGRLAVALSAAGDAALGLHVEARSCAVAWSAGSCPAGEQVVRQSGLAPLGAAETLIDLPTPATGRLLLTAWVLPDAAANGAESASLTLTANAGGESESLELGGIGGLANTGAAPRAAGIFAAPTAIGLGLGLAAIAAACRRGTRRGRFGRPRADEAER